MPNFAPTPWLLPGGPSLYFGDSVPTASTDGAYQAGDFLWITSATAGAPTLYKCTVSGSPGTWKIAALGVSKIVTTASAYQALVTDSFIVLTGNVAVTLPVVANATGQRIAVKRVGAANGTVVAAAGTLEGGGTATFGADLSAIEFISDGSVWRVIGKYGTVTLS